MILVDKRFTCNKCRKRVSTRNMSLYDFFLLVVKNKNSVSTTNYLNYLINKYNEIINKEKDIEFKEFLKKDYGECLTFMRNLFEIKNENESEIYNLIESLRHLETMQRDFVFDWTVEYLKGLTNVCIRCR